MTEKKKFKLKNMETDDEKGTVSAVFATLNVRDKDGDRILSGSIGEQKVVISAYGHTSWDGVLPPGRGKIFEKGSEAIIEGRFFLDTKNGMETYLTVKNLKELQEWSFALPDFDYQIVNEDGREIREISRITINEVSPVLMGSGIETRTLDIKGSTPTSTSTLKGALPSHSTDTVDESWDGPAATRNVEANRRALRAIHAWVDSSEDADPDSKGSYKFPHHSRPGAPANLRACSAIIAILNGARGGTDIPQNDRRGVYSHAARHLKDGDREVPELRSVQNISSKQFVEQINDTVEAIEQVVGRATKIRTLRDAKGGKISQKSIWHLQTLRTAISESLKQLDSIIDGNCNAMANAIAMQFEGK